MPDTEYLHLELTFNPFELSFARELDTDGNGRIDPNEWEAQEKLVGSRLLGCLKIAAAGRILTPELYGVTPDPDSHHATLRAHYRADVRRLPLRIESTLATITSGSHVTQVTISGAQGQQRAQLDMQSMVALFAPVEPLAAYTSAGHQQATGDRWLKWVVVAATLSNFGLAAVAMRRDPPIKRAAAFTPAPPPCP